MRSNESTGANACRWCRVWTDFSPVTLHSSNVCDCTTNRQKNRAGERPSSPPAGSQSGWPVCVRLNQRLSTSQASNFSLSVSWFWREQKLRIQVHAVNQTSSNIEGRLRQDEGFTHHMRVKQACTRPRWHRWDHLHAARLQIIGAQLLNSLVERLYFYKHHNRFTYSCRNKYMKPSWRNLCTRLSIRPNESLLGWHVVPGLRPHDLHAVQPNKTFRTGSLMKPPDPRTFTPSGLLISIYFLTTNETKMQECILGNPSKSKHWKNSHKTYIK